MKRWRGLKDLVVQGVHAGSSAIERVQKETAAVPFRIVEALPGVGPAARGVHTLYDAGVTAAHASVRGVASAVSAGLDVAMDVAEEGMNRSVSVEEGAQV